MGTDRQTERPRKIYIERDRQREVFQPWKECINIKYVCDHKNGSLVFSQDRL